MPLNPNELFLAGDVSQWLRRRSFFPA